MISLADKSLDLLLHAPEDGFYCGTRFDRSGVFGSALWRGVQMAGQWYEKYDPCAHDAVQGPAEEFSPVGFEEARAGDTFIKPGVGRLIRPDDAPYDRFRLYEISDPGAWSTDCRPSSVVFRHILSGVYDYSKEIVLLGSSCFEIRHSLAALGPQLTCEVYNHNFWTFGRLAVGPSRRIDFPFTPEGHWRSVYDSVRFTGAGVRFSRALNAWESVYSGDIHKASGDGMPYDMFISDNGVRVHIEGDLPVTRTVLWANHRIACLEPYNTIQTPVRWTIRYTYD